MPDWFDHAFRAVADAFGEARHELLGGWFGRHFEPHPSHQRGPEEPDPGERDIHGHEHGIDR
jgi:hypothetical protein